MLAAAISSDADEEYEYWPSPPPTRGDPCAQVLGVLADGQEFSLWLSEHILRGTSLVLNSIGVPFDIVERFVSVLVRISSHSGGAVIEPLQKVTDCRDWEDNRILELAAASAALLIISADDDLLSMSPWRGTPILDPTSFVARVDAMRRVNR